MISLALAIEGFAVGLLARQHLLTATGVWLRLGAAVAIGLTADFFTYAFIRAI